MSLLLLGVTLGGIGETFYRITEGGDTRITESGDIRITEDA
jgi:hypothetical protein